jgi:predicted enzyme related to lactoylglutathione lyase
VIETITPILRVDDLERSKRFYFDVLGFSLDWEAPEMVGVSRDGCGLMLCLGGQGQKGAWVWIGVEDAGALYADVVTAKGAKVRMAPKNFSWAYEFQLEDPDGHVLRFGSEPKDAPFED